MTIFVNQKKHNSSTDAWDNNVHVKDNMNAAFHQFHAFMSTYGYEQVANIDYASCSIETDAGVNIKIEVDDRRPVEESQQEQQAEE